MEVPSTSRQRALQIAMQLGVLSILTLITVAAFTHVVTMLLFRRLVLGGHKNDGPNESGERAAIRHPAMSGTIGNIGSWSEEFFVPVSSTLHDAASMEDDVEDPTLMQRTARKLVNVVRRVWTMANDLPNSVREGLIRNSGVSREVYVKCFHHRQARSGKEPQMLLLCNPSGETIETLSGQAVALSEAIGFDSLTMFDYRPTGRSCRGLVAPDTKTMLEDAESVIQWLITVKAVDPASISVAGISLGGLQAMRLAVRHKLTPRLLLINTFASFSCLLRTSASLIPGALRIGGTSAFLPDICRELHTLTTQMVAVVSVEEDERVPKRCTEEMLEALRQGGNIGRTIHVIMKGTHSKPEVDHNSLETIRHFLNLDEPLKAYDSEC